MLNACEGDGVRGARHVTVSAGVVEGGRVALHVVDDGPGLANKPDRGSRKRDGSGLGLLIVESLVGASGGALTLRDRRDPAHAEAGAGAGAEAGGGASGAHAVVTLPSAS